MPFCIKSHRSHSLLYILLLLCILSMYIIHYLIGAKSHRLSSNPKHSGSVRPWLEINQLSRYGVSRLVLNYKLLRPKTHQNHPPFGLIPGGGIVIKEIRCTFSEVVQLTNYIVIVSFTYSMILSFFS